MRLPTKTVVIVNPKSELEKFLFAHTEECCEEESFVAEGLATRLGIPMHRLRTLARQSFFTEYIRGTSISPSIVLVAREKLSKAKQAYERQQQEEQQRLASQRSEESAIQVLVSDLQAAQTLLSTAISQGISLLPTSQRTHEAQSHIEVAIASIAIAIQRLHKNKGPV